MSDKDFHPLTPICVRYLQDRVYDKRKLGALEIEKMVREFRGNGNYTDIETLLKLLDDEFISSSNPHFKKGGLIGLAAACIGLEKLSSHYCSLIICPVIRGLSDADERVRYYACEALYNIVKVTRGDSLAYFNDMFDALSKSVSDPDLSVRKGSAQLDHILKEIVMESSSFDIAALIPLLRERVYCKNSYARLFVISWVSTLEAVPDINMIAILPNILDGIFQMLTDKNSEIREKCKDLLEELLNGIAKTSYDVNYAAMTNILIARCQFTNEDDGTLMQLTALKWIHEFLYYANTVIILYASGILAAILPYFAYKSSDKIRLMETAVIVNEELMKVIKTAYSSTSAQDKVDNSEDNSSLYDPLNMSSILDVVCRLLVHTCELTRITSLRWLDIVMTEHPSLVYLHLEEVLPLLLKTMFDSSTSVVRWTLSILIQVASKSVGLEVLDKLPPDFLTVPECLKNVLPESSNPYMNKILYDLVRTFDTNTKFLAERGDLIITELCANLGADCVYEVLCLILINVNNLDEPFILVQAFNRILLTQEALYGLRTSIKAITQPSQCQLFTSLYKAWSYNAIALLALCLFTQNYEHASELIRCFGEIEITTTTLAELDQLIQLLESPIFAFLRLHLLDPRHSVYLQETLFCMLMCLPQTEAFHVLRRRLDCAPKYIAKTDPVFCTDSEPDRELLKDNVDFASLLSHFRSLQSSMKEFRLGKAMDKRLGFSGPISMKTP